MKSVSRCEHIDSVGYLLSRGRLDKYVLEHVTQPATIAMYIFYILVLTQISQSVQNKSLRLVTSLTAVHAFYRFVLNQSGLLTRLLFRTLVLTQVNKR